MKPVDTSQCLAHVLVCTNARADSGMPSCGRTNGDLVFEGLRQWIAQHGLLTRVWVTRTACLGWCHVEGTTVVIYPEGRWFRAVTREDIPRIIAEYLEPHVARGRG